MWDKLEDILIRYEELGVKLSSPEVSSDPKLLHKYSKEHKDLSTLVSTYKNYKSIKEEIDGSKEIVETAKDEDLISMAKEEISGLEPELEKLSEELKLLLLPKDPNDDKNIILEIRAGAGGDEAGIFAGDLFRSYLRFAETSNYKIDIMHTSEASNGGYKEVIAMINGSGAFSNFKYESGVHRVQRVPATESQGRIHTSTITVAVLPEAEDVEVEMHEKDLRIDVYRSSGPGGQSVNTTDSAVRITHVPTGVVVAMQDEKSQIKNKEKALKVLRARLYEKEQAEKNAERRDQRRTQVGTGDRSEKIRTYNFPQSRVTDHRIGLTLHSLDQIMNGELIPLVEALRSYYQAEDLKNHSD
ncbi:UNVERIFIED_CONTAM: hypothetical protein GTU68_063525 [Idotea baltica]|nr:hypothetical protein [Idotea baltica]